MIQKILILPCAGKSNVGQLTLHAAKEIVSEQQGELVDMDQIRESQKNISDTADVPPFIVVEGCEKQCARKRLEILNCTFEFHLTLTDLGIEKTEDVEIVNEELQLVIDAIIAESTRLSEKPPVILGGCGCR